MSEQGPTVFNGRYELLRHIARGGMADVYLARDELLGREVALKVLFPEFANDPNFVERFRREAQAAANLNDPHIVGIYDWGQERGTYYIVMEHVSGRSMSDVLRSTGPLSPDRAAEIAIDVAGALSVAHGAGLVHRDVKLGNILVSDGGDVKVADFGIATALAGGTDAGLTQHGSVMGTATYFSPEQAQGKSVDGRSDLYSLGVVLYEMLAGQPPFHADTPVAVAYKHVQEKPPSLSDRGVQVAQSLEAITMKLLAKKPANRYPTADDLRNDLRRYLAGAHKIPGRGAAAAAGGAAAAAGVGPAQASEASIELAEPSSLTPAATPPPVDATTAQPITPGAQPIPATPPAAATAAAPTDPNAAIAAAQYGGGYYYDEPARGGGGIWRTVALVTSLAVLVAVLGFLSVAFWRALGGEDTPSEEVFDVDADLVEVPRLTGQQVDAARAELSDLGLIVEVIAESNSQIPLNEVFGQTPPSGQRIEMGDTVELTVSSGPANEVPNVIGELEESALALLQSQGYEVQVTREASAREAGAVIGQDPGARTELASGEVVQITVSDGPDVVAIPDVEGLSVIAALNVLRDAMFNVSAITIEEANDEIPEGDVIRTEPAMDSLVAVGSPVSIVVSTGLAQVTVPELKGLFADTAIQTLRNQGLDPVVVFEAVPIDAPQVGRVISQAPAAFDEVDVGTAITITVGEGTVVTTTTTTTTTAAPTTSSTTTTTTVSSG